MSTKCESDLDYASNIQLATHRRITSVRFPNKQSTPMDFEISIDENSLQTSDSSKLLGGQQYA